MRTYCTYFDRNYAARALALIDSLEKFGGNYLLYALCLDVDSEAIIGSLELDRVISISLSDLEAFDPDMLATKPHRNLIDYYLTSTPCFLRYIIETYPEINQLAYLDADLYFFSDPEPIFNEIGDASVGLVPHNFSPERLDQEHYGKFNVSWLTVRRDENGLKVLNWYRERCIEWCYDQLEDDRFGDQKYLDLIPSDFPGVRLVTRAGVILGVWNGNNHEITHTDGISLIDGNPVVCFHFQGVWMNKEGAFDCSIPTHHNAPNSVMAIQMFQPYCNSLLNNLKHVQKIWPEARLEKTVRYDLPALASAKSKGYFLEKIGRPPWTHEDIIGALEEFHEIYASRPIADNFGGIMAPHAFATWFMTRELAPDLIVESGIWKGQSTWLLEQACPDARIISIDPDLSNRQYISKKAEYFDQDFSKLDWSKGVTDQSLVFFDDHQNAYNRLRQCRWFGFRHLILEDNYPPLQGDCYSLKKVFSESGFCRHGHTFALRNLSDLSHAGPLKIDEVATNEFDAIKAREELDIYHEFPPIFKPNRTRWGDDWSQHIYPTPEPLLKERKSKIHEIFWEEAMSYTWICYARLK